ncbi:MAG: hypothetical protein AAFY71_27720 [Bacteroidota bacterium]
MGVRTNVSFSLFSQDGQLLEKIHIDEYADEFVYQLLDDGGATFEPQRWAPGLTVEEAKLIKLSFDKESGSVFEGFATASEEKKDPMLLAPIWEKFEAEAGPKFESGGSREIIAAIRRYLEIAKQGNCLVQITVADF